MPAKTTTNPPTLTLERIFDATPERLWSFWTDPKKYAKWFNPAPLDLVIREFDVRPGGRVSFDMPQPDGNPNPQDGVFHVVDPYRELVSGSPDKSFLVTTRFEPVSATRTRLTVTVVGVPPEYMEPARQGWGVIFGRLEAQLAPPAVYPARRTYWPAFVIERTFRAPVEKVWKMWTTSAIAKWYWPEPFVGEVKHMDVRPGGSYEIAAAGLGHTSRGTYTDVVPNKRLGILAEVDFIPDVEPYHRADTIEFQPVPGGTRMVFTSSRMHTDEWQAMANGGFGSALDKLRRLVEEDAATPEGFTIERTFKASPEKVWKMWTTKEGIEKWWVPAAKDMGYDMTVREMDVRVGGKFAFAMENKDHKLVNGGTYTLVQPHWELGWTWHFDIFLEPGQKPYDVPIFVALEKTPEGGTRMLFTQGALATPEHTEGSRQGVLKNLEKMAQALDG